METQGERIKRDKNTKEKYVKKGRRKYGMKGTGRLGWVLAAASKSPWIGTCGRVEISRS